MSRVVTECKFDCKNRFRLFSDKRLEVSKLANMKRRKWVVCARKKKSVVVVVVAEERAAGCDWGFNNLFKHFLI